MLRNRILVVLGGCFVMASAAWADGVAYVDCASHPEETQVFSKPRRTPDVVASLPCGEGFTILLNGFIFSRIETKDGKIGYVYSNLISADHSGAAVAQPASARPPAATSNAPTAAATVEQPKAAAAAQAQTSQTAQTPPQAQATSAEPSATQTAKAGSNLPEAAASANTPAQVQAAPALPGSTSALSSTPTSAVASTAASAPSSAPSPAPASTLPTATSSVSDKPTTTSPAAPPAPAQAEAAPAHLVSTETAAPAASAPETPATAVQPEASPAPQPAAAQPEPAPAEPAAPPVRATRARESWEKPNAGYRTVGLRRMPLIELFGGYGFARLDGGGGTWTNLNGIVGAFGWNVKPWLQVVADTSYSVVTVGNTKNVIYGNHYGPRVFRRGGNRWGLTPFAEALVGGSRADITVSGTGGYSSSQNSFSMKVGGGLDFKPTRHFEMRLIDVDYYRTSFGVNVHQNNYWVSAGIVIRLFGRSE